MCGTHPESGGPFFDHWIDALQCEGINDVPMGEFWKRNGEPDGPITHHHNPSLKQAACAAHIYGKAVCQAEAFTSFGDDWGDDPWSLKDVGDAAFCEGLTRNVLCFWVHQPRLDAKPGFQWAHVGTHFDCNLTWWPMSGAWLTYLARCQHMLRQGLFVADFACLQDETIPSSIPPRPNQRPAGFDYDVLSAEVLLTRASAKDGRLVLPDGMSYRYLVSSQSARDATTHVVFRVGGKRPELWDAVTGRIRDLQDFHDEKGRTIVPLRFAPRQSWFVVFRKTATGTSGARLANFPKLAPVQELAGAWTVSFDPKWGGPERVTFEKLEDWTTRPEDGIRYYSGTATYRTTLEAKAQDPRSAVFLDLGVVRNVARVRLNGRDLGVVWTAPWRIEVTGALKAGTNGLEIEVANLWPNRLIGDATLPKDKRLTVTNVRTHDTMASGTYGCKKCEDRKRSGKPAALLPSGLLGPVTLQVATPTEAE